MEPKSWYLSRTLWVNAIAFVALVVQSLGTGFVIGAEEQVGILAVLNIILRLITKQPISG
mgnify:FL=1